MQIELRIKRLPNGGVACSNYTPYEEHLPESAKKAGRNYIKIDESIVVESREVAKKYTAGGMLEVVL